jgi:hypothetical protein
MSSFPLPNNFYPSTDNGAFALDTLAVMNYADDGYGDSVLAHGTIAHLSVASPLPVEAVQSPAPGQVQFSSDTNWLYTLEQTTDFQTWTPVTSACAGTGTNLLLQATNRQADRAFYRVRAEQP